MNNNTDAIQSMFYLSVHITSCWHLLVCSWSVSEDKNQPRTERHQHICCCFFFLCLSKMNRTTVTEEIYHWFLIFLSRFIMLRTVKSLMLSIFFHICQTLCCHTYRSISSPYSEHWDTYELCSLRVQLWSFLVTDVQTPDLHIQGRPEGNTTPPCVKPGTR